MNLIKTIKVELERKSAEHTFSLILFSFFFLFAINKGSIEFLTFFLAYWVFGEEIVKGKISYLLKLPYKKINLFIANYIFGLIIALVPMLTVMLFFGFNPYRLRIFLSFYTSIFAIQTFISVFISKGSLIILVSFLILIVDNALSSINTVYHDFSITSTTYFSLIYSFLLFSISYFIFKHYVKE